MDAAGGNLNSADMTNGAKRYSPGENTFITIRVHAETSLQYVFGFAFASHAGKMKASRQMTRRQAKHTQQIAASLVEL